MKHHILSLSFLAALLMVLAACSTDDWTDSDRPAEGMSRVRIEVGTSEMIVPEFGQKSRATSWKDQMARDGEMMLSGYVVVVKESDQIIQDIIPLNITAQTEVEMKNLGSIDVENGNYTFYSFANFPDNELTYNAGTETLTLKEVHVPTEQTFQKGSTFPSIQTLAYKPHFNDFPVKAPATDADYKGIPMTNYETFSVNTDMTVRLVLYRLLSKLRFDITNATGKDLTLESLKLGSITPDYTADNKSVIYFLPRKNENNQIELDFPVINSDPRATVDITVGENMKLAASGDGAKASTRIYFNESQSTHPSRQFPLTLTYSFNNAPENKITRYALMKLSDLPRNNAAIVPISITNYDVLLQTFFYPPIGGYPSFTQEDHSAEGYYTIIFKGSGDILIRPFVYNFADRDDPTKWFELTDQSKIESYSLEVEDPNGIFEVKPHFDAVTGEILATLHTSNAGTATVQLNVYIKINDVQTQVFTRTLYIVKN